MRPSGFPRSFTHVQRRASSFACLVVALNAACGDANTAALDSALSDGEDALTAWPSDLWAGLPSVAIARFVPDACDDGRTPLDDTPVEYETWARQRASVRNVCFEVWKPGVTDWDHPDFWKLLDVQAHWRYVGEDGGARTDYVNSIDRRGNNRRYAWSIGFQRDPFHAASSLVDPPVPVQILSESETNAEVEALMQVHFTVNGHVLAAPSGAPFVVRYTGTVQKHRLSGAPADHILYPAFSCADGALTAGSGPGYFAAVVRDPAAVELFAPAHGIEYAVPTSSASDGDAAAFSVAFWAGTPASGGTLPSYSDAHTDQPRALLRGEQDRATLYLRGYDRSLGTVRDLSYLFTDCVRAP